MKAKLFILAGVMVALVAAYSVASAQVIGEVPVKVMSTEKKGVLNIRHIPSAVSPIEVRFYTDDQTIQLDKIEGEFPKGFQRKYDLSNVNAESFRVEINSANVSVTYQLINSGDGSYKPVLEKTIYYHTLVAANH